MWPRGLAQLSTAAAILALATGAQAGSATATYVTGHLDSTHTTCASISRDGGPWHTECAPTFIPDTTQHAETKNVIGLRP